jgi:hypothetical protein
MHGRQASAVTGIWGAPDGEELFVPCLLDGGTVMDWTIGDGGDSSDVLDLTHGASSLIKRVERRISACVNP